MPYKDPIKQKAAQQKHYRENKERFLSRNQNRRAERKKWFREITRNAKCVFCPEAERVCLDWHHKDPKEKVGEVSNLLNKFRSKTMIVEELQKCIPICSNCHRKVHAGMLDASEFACYKVHQ